MPIQYDFNEDGQLIVEGVTLNNDTTWKIFEIWIDGYCRACGTEINQHEIVCDKCLERASKYRTSGRFCF